MTKLNKIVCLFLFFTVSKQVHGQFTIPVYWTGGGGGGNTEVCALNVLTLTADPIPPGMTYRWISEPGWCPPGSSFTILNNGSQVLYFGESAQIICQAIDSFNQVQGESWPIPVINPDFNGGICDLYNSGGTISACQGESIVLRCNQYLPWSAAVSVSTPGDTVLQWQKNGIDLPGTVNNGNYSATSTGTYRLKFKVSCGVGYSNPIIVNFASGPTPIITGTNVICQGANTNLNAGSGYLTYSWSTGANTQTINVSSAGTYAVTVTDANGCSGTDTITVIVNPLPAPVITGTNVICQGSTAVLNAGGGFTYYNWSNGAASQTIAVGTAGLYTVWVTDANSCTGSDTFVLTVLPNPIVSITGTTNICAGSNTTICVSSPYACYLWSTGQMTSCVNLSTAGVYTVTVCDINGCTSSATAVLTINPNPIPQITGDSTLCLPQTSILNAVGGFPGFTSYFWSNGVFTQANTVSTIGTYTVTVTDNNGCTGSDSIQVTGTYATISGDNSICSGNGTDLFVQFVGNPPFMYSYHNGTTTFGPYSTANNPQIIPVSPGTNTTYTLVNYADANCFGNVFGSATITMSNPMPVITGDSTICPGQITVLNAGTGYAAYFWSTGDVAQTTNVGGIGTYSVTVLDANGCSGTGSFTVILAPPYPTVLTASGPLGICQGDSVQLFAQTPMNSFQWYKNNIPVPGATSSSLWVSASGRYKCQSVDVAGCSATSNQVRVSIVCIFLPPPIDKEAQSPSAIISHTVFPNPSSDIFYLSGPGINESAILITDITGKSVKSNISRESNNDIKISGLDAGSYILRIAAEQSIEIFKLVQLQ